MTKYVSILNGGTNNHQVSAADFNYLASDFISPGVVGAVTNTSGVAPSTGSFAVNAQSTPNNTTQVSAGTGYVTATPLSSVSQTFRVNDTSGTTITHAANTSGATRYDWIYVQLDPTALANPSSDGSSPLLYTVSRSTSNTTDNGTPPTYAIPVAIVTLANSFSTVTNANITDKRIQSVVNSIPGTNSYSYGNFYNPYKTFAYLGSGGQTLAGTSATKLTLNNKAFDTGSNFDAVTNYRFTVPVTGFYQVNYQATLTVGSTQIPQVFIYKNGAVLLSAAFAQGGSSSNSSVGGSGVLQLVANDYLELWGANTNAGTGVVGGAAPYATYLLVSLMSTT